MTTKLNTKDPTSHASTGSTYGLGTTTNYGHVKLINSLTQNAHADGAALSAYQGKLLNDKITSLKLNTTANYASKATASELKSTGGSYTAPANGILYLMGYAMDVHGLAYFSVGGEILCYLQGQSNGLHASGSIILPKGATVSATITNFYVQTAAFVYFTNN